MALPRNNEGQKSTTAAVNIKIINVQDAEKHALAMRAAMQVLQHDLYEMQAEYMMYSSQKSVVTQDDASRYITLFASDFHDFKEALNKAIRGFKKIHEDFKFQLAILGKEDEFNKTLFDIETTLNKYRDLYFKDKNLYVGVNAPKTNQDAAHASDSAALDDNQTRKSFQQR